MKSDLPYLSLKRFKNSVNYKFRYCSELMMYTEILRPVCFLLLILCLFVIPSSLNAAYSHDPSLKWYTLKSPHFYLHYHEGLEEMARETLALAEDIHTRLSPKLGWEPGEPVNIVLTDEYDLSNGMASPVPYNWMKLFASPPDDLSGLEDHAGWMELLLIHEYTHVLHLDKARRGPATLRNIFGRNPLLFPNIFQPRWLLEGYATYLETDTRRNVGRGQSSLFAAMMRTEVQGRIKPLRQVNQPMASWPGGTGAYLYGVHFYQFLSDTYGEETIDRLINAYSDNLVPFKINSNAQSVLGNDLSALWDEFEDHLKQKYTNQIESIASRGKVEGKQVTHDGYFISSIKALPDGSVFYVRYDGKQHAQLIQIDSDGSTKPLSEVNFGARLDVHPEAGILLTQPERCRNAAVYYDIYHMNLQGGNLRRLSHCARYRHAVWSSEGNKIYAVYNKAGRNELHQLDSDGNVQAVLWKGAMWEVIAAMDTAPDDSELVASVWRQQGGWNLEIFSMGSRQWRQITHGTGIEGQPQYTLEGDAILYTSDQDGVYNLRKLNLREGQTTSLTNVISAAMSPVQTSSDDIYYLGYTSTGIEVFLLPHSQRTNLPVKNLPQGPSGESLVKFPGQYPGDSESYAPWDSMRPRWWFPWYFVDDQRSELGFSTGGFDSLQRHFYSLALAWDSENSLPLGYASYVYDGWYPLIRLEAERSHEFYSDLNDVTQRIRREEDQSAEMALPFLSMNHRFSVNLGTFKNRNSDAWLNTGVMPVSSFTDNVVGLGILYDSTERHIKSVSRSSGREISLVWEDSDRLSGSDYSGRVRIAEWREFISLGNEHVLAMRLTEGKGSNFTRSFRLGGANNSVASVSSIDNPLGSSPFNRRKFNLRGYPEGLPQLTGQNMRLATLEYRFPLARIERGLMAPPLGVHQVHATLFYERGTAWSTGTGPDNHYSSNGFEINMDTTLFYSALLQISMGYAKGQDLGGEKKWYVRLGATF